MEKNSMQIVSCAKCARQIVDHEADDAHCIGPSAGSLVDTETGKVYCPQCAKKLRDPSVS